MRLTGWRVGAGVLFFVLSLAGCSDDDVNFPGGDSGSDVAAESGADVSMDRGTEAGRPDVALDISTDPTIDERPDSPTADRAETGVDGPADAAPDTADVTIDTNDATDANDVNADVASEPAIDGGDDSSDAVSEEAGPTCATRCASGVCDMNGDCTPCVKDDECSNGQVCNAGTCGPRCGDGGAACTGNLVCCTDHCVDITRDPQHCGACTTECTATQFCGNASTPACRDNLVRNVCNTKKATFLLDGLTDDDNASNVIKNAIGALCVPAPALASVPQITSTAINNTTGQPIAGGGELLVAAGGDSWQRLVRYLETSGTSAVYNETDGVTQLQFKRRGGASDGGDSVLQTVLLSSVTPSHDYFLVYVVKDPISGTFSLVVYGIDSPGTRAGAFYFANVILPDVVGADVTTFTQAWYLYEWTASDAGSSPSMSDTFTQIAAGL